MDNELSESILTPELYFLISKFLTESQLQETAKILVKELENKKVLPKRLDWLGTEHEQTFAELEQKYAHIGPNHLFEICCRIGPILDKELKPSVPGIISLLGAGRQSLLRTRESIYRARSLVDYCTRMNGVSLPDSCTTKPVHNLQKVLIGREYGGPVRRKLLVPTSIYTKVKLLRRTVGHLSSVYCVLFDRTGRYIITGADDLLIKVWSAIDGRLLATLRGASAEITDIAINLDNTMLAAGSLDRILRVWDLQTTSPIAVLPGHTGMITSVNFCPSPRSDLKYLVTTSTDGSIAFWQYSTPRGQKISFAPKPTQYHEKLRPGQAQMMCTTFSPGGIFLAAGSADHHVRVYLMSEDGPKRILESEAYTDAVDSVQWSHKGLRFISGSKDGTAHIWTFESQQWKSVKLCMTERLSSCPEPEEGKKLKVTMVAWDCSDKYVITAVNDFTIKIWNSKTAKLHCVLRGHKDELYVLESNPKDEHILMSAGHDGQVFLWDIDQGISITHYVNDIDGHGHGGVFDAKWSPDGTMIAATDSHGHILIFGLGIAPDKYKMLPTELFFHTDYRPLVRDASHHVIDEQIQVMPHLMPPPFLVDADGNPHPANFQRFVPGRENCTTDQLIPNLTVNADGVVIVDNAAQSGAQPAGGGVVAGGAAAAAASGNYSHIDRLIAVLANRQGGAPSANSQGGPNHSQLDRMIEALANRQGQDQAPDSNNRPQAQRAGGNILGNGTNSARNAPDNEALNRRFSETNSTPQQRTAWGQPPEQQQPSVVPPVLKYVRRIYVRPMKYAQLQNLKQTVYAAGQFEMQEYKREMRRRPIMINTASAIASSQASVGRPRNTRAAGGGGSGGNTNGVGRTIRRRGGQAGTQHRPAAYRTRAVRDQEEIDIPPPPPEEEDDDDESSASSGDTSFSNVEENLVDTSEDSDTESSDYSDWVADTPGPNLEPPKRSKRKPLSRRRTFSDDSSDETTEHATTSAGAGSKRRNKRIVIPPPAPNGEIPEVYRPAEWLSEVIPRKAPYYPQMGDEVVYFRQGHQRYLDAVRVKKVYKLSHNSEPWNFHALRDHELVRVIGIKYEIRPPRLCCLKLAMIDEDGNMSGTTFKIKYHDMPDVLDFLVLRQTFDLAVQRNWSIGDRFRCMIGDGWWMGQIESRHTLSPDFPDSYFMCFRVRWDNGEYEYMSPWDMEPIDENRLPDEVGGAVPVLPEEIRATLYQPKSEEWPRGDRDGSCRRIINGLEQVMRLSIAEHFLAPVDLNIYPDYAYLIEYPIDLTTIKSRFENHFYRRITSAQFDVRYLATNAEKYNRSHTYIVKHARIITDLCLRIIREQNEIDVAAVYHQLVDVYHSSETENDNESDAVPSTSTGPSTSAAAARQNMSSIRRSNRIRSDGDWRSECRQLLDMMWQRPDSLPFREPVDTIEFPDYLEIISTPMDLRTVKEDLLGGNYEDPLDFAKDVRLIFQNSKNYNTNKRSRIYSMTLRLSALFESHIKTVVSNWKAARRRANKNKSAGRSASSSPTKRTPPERNRTGTSTRRKQKIVRRLNSSDDDDDDDDDEETVNENTERNQREREEDDERPGGSNNKRRGGGRNGIARGPLVASTSANLNRVTSSSSASNRRGVITEDVDVTAAQQQQQPTRSSRRLRASQEIDDEDDDDDEEDEEDELNVTDEHTSESSSDDDEDETSDDATSDDASDSHANDDDDDDDQNDSPERRVPQRGRPGRKRRKLSGDEDSEESYNPNNYKRAKANRKKHHKLNKKNKMKQTKRRRRVLEDDEDDDHHELQAKAKQSGASKSRARPSSVADERNDVDGAAVGAVARGRGRRHFRSSGDEGATTAANSQIDESTQDTINNTPKKKGRPPKAKIADGPSTSAGLLQQSPSRNTRLGGGNRRNATENDHSYHLPVRNGRMVAESDTDSREMTARPTRASLKRAVLDWARGSDVEDAEESEEPEEILPTPTPTKMNGSTANSTRDTNGPSTSRAALAAISGGAAMRQLRTNRNTKIASHDEDTDEDEGSDNEPLATSQRSQGGNSTSSNRAMKTTAHSPHPLALQRREPHAVAISAANNGVHMTRSHATSTTTTSNTAATSSSSVPLTSHDHNYLGNPTGPSSSSTSTGAVRNTRRVVSRHQCNADELDMSGDNSRLFMSSSRFTRASNYTPTTTATTTNNEERATMSVRRGRSRYSQENSQSGANDEDDDVHDDIEEEDEEDVGEDAEADEDGGASDEGTNGDSSSQSDEASDSEDNQPLKAYVPKASKRNHGKSRRAGRRGRPQKHSEDSLDCDDDDEDYEVAKRHRHHGNDNTNGQLSKRQQRLKTTRRVRQNSNSNERSDRNGAGRQQRGSRNLKRPHYNEDSDEDAALHQYVSGRKKRRDDIGNGETVASSSAVHSANAAASSSNKNAANDRNHGDDYDDETSADSEEQLGGYSVSSRGRVRKITAKARGIFKE